MSNDYPRPIVYDVGAMPIINGRLVPLNHNHSVTIEYRASNKWAICDGRRCLSKNGTFEFEPMPSSRDDEFLNRTRFDSMMEAYDFYQKWRSAVIKWAERELAKGIILLNIPDNVLNK